MEPRALNRIVTRLGITQIVGWGSTFYVPAVLAARISEDTGWSLTLVVGAFSWCMLVSGLLSRSVGALLDRRGARVVMSWGSLSMTLGLAIAALARHEIVFLAAWTLLGFGMRAALYDAAFTALAKLADGGARRAISIVTLWGGLASTVFWPIGHLLGSEFGWRVTLGVYALLNLLICLPLHRSLPGANRATATPIPASPPAGSGPGSDHAVGVDGRLHGSARERALLVLSAIFAGHALVWSSMSAHLMVLLGGLGLGAGLAVTLSTAIGVAQVASRTLELFAQKRLAPLATGVLAMTMLAVALALLYAGTGIIWVVMLACLIYGAANGLITIVRGALPLVVFGNLAYGATLGRIAAPGLVCSALAPVVFAMLLERVGSHAAMGVLLLIGGCSLSGMVWIAWQSRAHAPG